MVTCSKCGTENKDDGKFCVNCGANLQDTAYGKMKKEDECFGLPHGGAIFGLFIGVIIILWGLSSLLGWHIELGTFAIIAFGLLIVAGAIYGIVRKR